ncbi:ABC-type sugar transport system, substrate-binding protein, contains N-terminal xre family HTH domain [Pseudomonas cuatrocienegasensis]|uniref:ABC-type sugar transport system, substrate-binding protein, contains N-terminal xre family HTH domain n=1 Tax=Pseudomonas cuatrocienegasensis TaxID=543360 RepID=A0ABY1BF49_9PSED|nr:ABC-type sugar transport system, substrate-binding protein, contains N-terminal xre family HTH domain [Pseudomonas cuatrocienegasensis]
MFRWVVRYLLLATLLMLGVGVQAAVPKPASVVFLNPGHANEPFWVSYSEFMQEAARDLGMQLHIVYGARDTAKLLAAARKVLESSEPPDYLMFVNEQYVGPEILRLFAQSPIKVFAVHSTLTAEQQALVGASREQYRNWIGSLVPNDEEAGYLMASALIESLGQRSGELLALSGVRHTPSASLRQQGLARALAEHPHVRLQQLVYGEWSRKRAYEQARALLQRRPGTDLIWSANDEMAFGALQAVTERGLVPGKDVHISGLNSSEQVLQARIDGRISVLVAGHNSLGAWALVMLYDYHAGYDFSQHGGKDQVAPVLQLIDAAQARQLLKRLAIPGYGIDFRRYSVAYQPDMKHYDFNLHALLE